MRIKIFSVLCFVTWNPRCSAVVSYNPADWAEITLKFSAEGTLKDIFDSGIRPFAPPGFETTYLAFKHLRLTVQTSEGMIFPEFPVEHAEITCTPAGRLKDVIMVTPSLSLAGADAGMNPWLPLIGRSRNEMETFFKIVSESPANYDDINFGKAPDGFGGGWNDKGNISYGVMFRKNVQAKLPLRMTLSVSYFKLRTRAERHTFHFVAIAAPPGYEGISLVPPEHWGPDSELQKMRALDMETNESPQAVLAQRLSGERPPLPAPSPAEPPSSTGGTALPVFGTSLSGIWRWWPWLLLVACVLWLGKKLVRR